jgi:hypothetical protein
MTIIHARAGKYKCFLESFLHGAYHKAHHARKAALIPVRAVTGAGKPRLKAAGVIDYRKNHFELPGDAVK